MKTKLLSITFVIVLLVAIVLVLLVPSGVTSATRNDITGQPITVTTSCYNCTSTVSWRTGQPVGTIVVVTHTGPFPTATNGPTSTPHVYPIHYKSTKAR